MKKVKSLSPIGEKRDLIKSTNSKTLQDSYIVWGVGVHPVKRLYRKKVKSLSPIGEKRDLIKLTNSKTLQDSYRMGGVGVHPVKRL